MKKKKLMIKSIHLKKMKMNIIVMKMNIYKKKIGSLYEVIFNIYNKNLNSKEDIKNKLN